MASRIDAASSPALLTVREAASLARVSVRTIDRWIIKGAVRAVRASAVARRRMIPAEDVDPRQHLSHRQ